MADTFTQLHIHIVFAVKYRHALLHAEIEERVFKYITGIAQNRSNKMIAINGMPTPFIFCLECASPKPFQILYGK